MMRLTLILVALVLVITVPASVVRAEAPSPEQFVVDLYKRFAFRDPAPTEVAYFAQRVLTMSPEAAERHLKHWFFVHAAYKTSLDRTVTIHEVKRLVDMLDSGQVTFEAIQWSIFTSDEYKQAKAEGRAGKNFMVYRPSPL